MIFGLLITVVVALHSTPALAQEPPGWFDGLPQARPSEPLAPVGTYQPNDDNGDSDGNDGRHWHRHDSALPRNMNDVRRQVQENTSNLRPYAGPAIEHQQQSRQANEPHPIETRRAPTAALPHHQQ
jgi:hypothetical protein